MERSSKPEVTAAVVEAGNPPPFDLLGVAGGTFINWARTQRSCQLFDIAPKHGSVAQSSRDFGLIPAFCKLFFGSLWTPGASHYLARLRTSTSVRPLAPR